MRTSVLSIATAIALVAPSAAQAVERDKLAAGEARSATRAYVRVQVEALEQITGLSVTSARISGRLDRLGPRRLIVPVAFTLRWVGEPSFVCVNRVYVTERGRAIRAQPANFDCG